MYIDICYMFLDICEKNINNILTHLVPIYSVQSFPRLQWLVSRPGQSPEAAAFGSFWQLSGTIHA